MISTPSAKGPPALGAARLARRPVQWMPWAIGVTVLAVAGGIVLATAGDGAVLERLLAPLEFLQQPYGDLVAASQGEDAATGAEYVAFLAEGQEAAALR